MTQNELVKALAARVSAYKGPPLRIMEVCGTHTHENFRLGIRSLLPAGVRLIAGPGCPVCVTPSSYIDEALYLAQKGVTICSFGDLLRVPGGGGSLADARALGAKIRIVYSPFDALDYALEHKEEQTVFLSVGFETTTPSVCLAVKKARAAKAENFTLLTANKTMVNVYNTLSGCADAFLYPGHVSAITGTGLYERLLEQGISGVVAGFTAAELLCAVAVILEKSAGGEPFAVNCYTRVVTSGGSEKALSLMNEVTEPCDAQWRGLGIIKGSGLRLNASYAEFDARSRFCIPPMYTAEPAGCRCGDVLRGVIEPSDCPLFGKACTPQNPRGACMVSAEGACSAYYQYAGV